MPSDRRRSQYLGELRRKCFVLQVYKFPLFYKTKPLEGNVSAFLLSHCSWFRKLCIWPSPCNPKEEALAGNEPLEHMFQQNHTMHTKIVQCI